MSTFCAVGVRLVKPENERKRAGDVILCQNATWKDDNDWIYSSTLKYTNLYDDMDFNRTFEKGVVYFRVRRFSNTLYMSSVKESTLMRAGITLETS